MIPEPALQDFGAGLRSTSERLLETASIRRGAPCARYAPSPTGDLHLGNLRTALLSWLQARLFGAAFVIRMEDLDTPRNRPGSRETILRDLNAIGLDWDEGGDAGGPVGPYDQSERQQLYVEAFEALLESGRIYPCYCSRRDIREAASAPHGTQPIYPGTCRPPTQFDYRPGRSAAWRFQVAPGERRFHDCVNGMYRQDLAETVGDFVVKRKDECFAYQLAVVVDDALMGVTDVLRAEDLLDSTPRQIELQAALGLPTPRYWHVPMMQDAAGVTMSKRYGSCTLGAYLDQGGSPQELVSELAVSVGLIEPGPPLTPMELLRELTPESFVTALYPPQRNGE